jgi:serine/threonine protein kinase/tetratricopeptide (TPR) repeat protein
MPERLGKYEILERLGQGAMGVVYHAHDPLLDREVAIKVMLSQVAGDPDQKLRFEREARAVARMLHPNVVTLFDLGYHTDGAPYLVMELLRGKDLLQILHHGQPVSLDRKVEIILQVLQGLSHAHAAGIVHRDIKPANVFLTDEGAVKITDFGVARLTTASVTGTGVVVGTADYMSPEQVSGAHVDGRSDLFSVGAMLCEMLTGRRPFHSDSLVTILFKIAHEEPRVELPAGPEHEALLPILKAALAKDAATRYQTAAEFMEALRAWQRDSSAAASVSTEGRAGEGPGPRAVSHGSLIGHAETIDLAPIVLDLGFGTEAPAPVEASPPVSSPPVPLPLVPAPPPDPTPVFRLLRDIYAASKSGYLRFLHRGSQRSLCVRDGAVLHGMSDARGEHLGDVLVRYGKLRQVDLEAAIEVVLRERRRLGSVLLAMGLLDRKGLDEAVGLHAREILFDAIGNAGWSFTFEESLPDVRAEDDGASNLSTLELILEAARRVQDPAVVRKVVGSLERVPVVARDAFNRFRNIALTPADGFLLSRIDGRAAARDLFQIIPLPAEDVERSLFSLLSTGVVEYHASEARVPAQRLRAVPPPASPGPPVTPPASRAPTPPMAAPEAAAPAPRPFPPPHPTGASEARRALEEERSRREEEAKGLEATRRMIQEAFDGLRTKDHFEFLGISRDASDVQVKEAYFRLAKPFHPDSRLDPRLSDLQDKRDAIFIRVGQAYEVLRTKGSRGRYLDTLKAVSQLQSDETASFGEPPVSDAAHAAWLARESLLAAEEHHREGRYWDAIQLFESTIPRLEGADRLRARVGLARAQMKNPNWVKRAEQSLHALLQEHPQCVEALLVLAELYRSTEMPSRALAMYRRALEIDHGNKEAQAAVRFLQSPEGGMAPDGGKLLRKLFGNKP